MSRLFALLALLAACGSSGPDDRPMSSLSREELNAACTEAVQSRSPGALRGAARVACLIREEEQEECRSEDLAPCVEDLLTRVPVQYCDIDDKVFASTSSCDEPVQLLVDCIDDHQEQFARLQTVTCETEFEEDPIVDPASCEALYDLCGLPHGLLENQIHNL